MANDRAIGALILIGAIIGIVLYGWFVYWVPVATLQVVSFIAVVVLLGIFGWIGWTMAAAPAPEPIEDIDLGEIETPKPEMSPEELTDELTSIRGVTETRARSLIDAGFASPKTIRSASIEELTEVTGIGPKLAGKIKDKFS